MTAPEAIAHWVEVRLEVDSSGSGPARVPQHGDRGVSSDTRMTEAIHATARWQSCAIVGVATRTRLSRASFSASPKRSTTSAGQHVSRPQGHRTARHALRRRQRAARGRQDRPRRRWPLDRREVAGLFRIDRDRQTACWTAYDGLAASAAGPRENKRARLVAVAALGFAFGSTSASALASVAVVEAYRRVMWTAAVLAVVAALTAIAWLGDDPPEHRGRI